MGILVENKIVDYIKKSNTTMSNDDESILRYGIQIYYYTISKLIILVFVSIILNVFLDVCIVTLLIGGLKRYAFGFHAETFWTCLIITFINIFGIVYLSRLSFNPYVKLVIALTALLIFYIYAPADTEERPIVNSKTRKELKFKTMIISVFYCLLSLFVKEYLSNIIILSLVFVGLNTCPIPYILFKKEYNNYEKYV